MKKLTELKSNWSEIKEKSEQKFTMLIDSDILLCGDTRKEISISSPVSLIISRLIAESKQGEMLSRLQAKLGRTKEEVYMLISEL